MALGLVSCREPAQQTVHLSQLCRGDPTAIEAVQGDGFASPLAGETVAVRGIVTRVESGKGFFIEAAGKPTHPNKSRALFVADAELSRTVRTGQELGVSGRVAELGAGPDTLTSLIESDAHTVCAEATDLPLSHLSLPLSPLEREGLEGMRVALDGALSLSDVYDMYRGEWTLSAGEPLRLPTEDMAPGQAAADLARANLDRALVVVLPGPDFPALPAGTGILHAAGVMGNPGGHQRLMLESTPRAAAPEAVAIGPPAAGRLRIVSLNLLNYFNGDGEGGDFPTARGAASLPDFEAQQARIRTALALIQPHLLAVQELENDGFGAYSAARSLLDLLNATGSSDWAFIDPGVGRIGGDIITVGLFFRQQVLEPVGSAELLRGAAFENLSRVPVAQRFRERASGVELLVAVNHLKSKGRCPDGGPDSDQDDGQGCWNRARVDAVHALTPWLAQLADESGTGRVLILGDMNAWRREDPIAAYRDAGYLELVEQLSGLPQYSYLFFGQRGTLDYALASPALSADARQAVIWHVNADWPREMPLPQPWLRMSDHDPVVVEFEFSQADTSD
jgi:predicted extracellular nuclease